MPRLESRSRSLSLSDGEEFDQFGASVAISDVRAIIGANLNDDNGGNSGAAYLTATDTDRDGLLDSWENIGIPYIDAGGVQPPLHAARRRPEPQGPVC